MFGLGAKNPPIDVRAKLAEVCADIGGDAFATQALGFFDDRASYEAWAETAMLGVPWLDDGYEPADDELASEILHTLLIEDRRAVVLDWADGAEQVLDGFDEMFARVGAAPLDASLRARLIDQCADAKRGGAVTRLMDAMEKGAAARGHAVHWWNTESDAHLPVLLSPAGKARWRGERFGKDFAVLP